MGRARDPNRDKAFEIYKQNNGNITNRKLGDILGVPEKTISVWKLRDKWNKCSTTKDKCSTTKRTRGAPKGNKNGKGGTVGNKNAVKLGLFAKYLPQEVYEITQELEEKAPIDILWENITLTYANLLHAQKILYVDDKDDSSVFISSDGKKGKGFEHHTAWDKQSKALAAVARVQAELRNMIKAYDEMTRASMVTEEQQLRIDTLKAKLQTGGDEDGEIIIVDAWSDN
ncbi:MULTISPECIES: phage terminase small subunit [Pseudomonadati]|uniref:Terminase n=3 Tax=Bacteria TaxID=2 RepID=A0A7K0GNC3_PARDI|nr:MULTISPECIES: phage terminase small subunit [Bacteria]MRY60411.1 terminase [Parabacteroides distasonis]MRY69593.1 terminase [Parabacteroides distasonis]MSA33726.1 terminase [Parabacteroides distasonis]MSA77399.1 terminase [Parabacteroides distasonis]MTU02647.1 terminase [Parasutterella excrementihominis]